MQNYLGEIPVEVANSPFKEYDQVDWAMYFIEKYGGIDGEHHKTWVIDQVARLRKGTKPIIVLARWDIGNNEFIEEYRVRLGEPGQAYLDWVNEMKRWNEEDQSYEDDYDEGIAP